MAEILHDLRSAVRTLARRPLLPAPAVAILALGLAAGTARRARKSIRWNPRAASEL